MGKRLGILLTLTLAIVLASATTATAAPVATVESVTYTPPDPFLEVTVGIPLEISHNLEPYILPYGLSIQVSYLSDLGNVETVGTSMLISDTTLGGFIDADTIAVRARVSLGGNQPPGPDPNFGATVAVIDPVAYTPGDTFLDVTVGIPRSIRDAITSRVPYVLPYSLRIQVTYASGAGTIETVDAIVLVSDTTFVRSIDAFRVAVRAHVPLGEAPPPGALPNFVSSVEPIEPVTYNQGDTFLDVTVAIPKALDDAARSGAQISLPYRLGLGVNYVSNLGTLETVESVGVWVSDTTFVEAIDADTVAVRTKVALGGDPAPGAAPNFDARAGLTGPVGYRQGDSFLGVTVGIPKEIDTAARNGAQHSLRIVACYTSNSATGECVQAVVLVSDTAFVDEIDADSVAVLAQVPLGTTPAPGSNPNFNATVELIERAITPLELCQLTHAYVQSSAKYQALSPAKKAEIDALANALCQKIAAIVPTLTPAQKAKLVKLYKLGVDVLAASGWLTAQQAATLKTLADTL